VALRSPLKGKGEESLFPFFVFLISLLYGSLNFYLFSKLPEFRAPIPGSDTALYWFLGELGKEEGVLLPDFKNYFFSPIYAYLFVLFSHFGNSVSLASLFSLACYVLSSLLLFSVSRLIFKDSLTAFIGALLFTFYKPVAFYALLPLKTMFFILVFLSFLYFLLRESSFLSGVFAGLSILVEGMALPLVLVSLTYSLLKGRPSFRKFLVFLCGLSFILAPFSFRNLLVGGSLIPLSPVSGIHLYIGNNERATGIYRRVPGVRPNAFGHYFDAKEVAERESRRKLSDGEVNDFWKKKAISFIKENPKRFVLLYLDKLLLTFNRFEVPNNFNIYVVSELIPTLKYNLFDFSILFPLGLSGVILFLLREKRLNLLLLLLAVYPSVLSLFFITSRYRIVLVLFLIPYAAYLLRNLKELRKPPLKLTFILLSSLLAFKVSNLNFPQLQKKAMERAYVKRVFFASRIGDIERKLQATDSQMERKRLLLREARLFYLAGMKEVGNFLREKALSVKIKDVKQRRRAKNERAGDSQKE